MAFDCAVHLRNNPQQHKKLVRIGCGAGFAGDRPFAALKLLLKVPDMHYLVLECLAERTLAIRHEALMAGGKGYDPRISEWMQLLLPEAVRRNVCIITNMGGVDPEGAQEEVLKAAKQYELHISVGVVCEVLADSIGSKPGSSTYLGAAPIVKLLEESKPNVILTSRVADASLFLGPMVYELGWNWDDFGKLAQGTLAGHLLECGCQVTGGYYAYPADEYRNLSTQRLVDVSLPFAEINEHGDVVIAKPKDTGGELSANTCGQQLLYEVGDPSFYITPDLVVDFTNVTFEALNDHQVAAKGARPGRLLRPDKLLRLIPEDCGWKAWGEISYGGVCCIQRAEAAEMVVRAWMEEVCPQGSEGIVGYLMGINSLLIAPNDFSESREVPEVRLHMDGLFRSLEQAVGFTREFEALYTNGPAGGGGISIGCKKETILNKNLVCREETFWKTNVRGIDGTIRDLPSERSFSLVESSKKTCQVSVPPSNIEISGLCKAPSPAPGGLELPLYKVAHCRAGDKGNDVNFSLIPHCSTDLPRLESIITKDWVRRVTRHLLLLHPNAHQGHEDAVCSQRIEMEGNKGQNDEDGDVGIYVARGIHALNIVVRNALDGGVTCSRRIDRHGKSLSDLILCQTVRLPGA